MTYKIVNSIASRSDGGVNSAKYWDRRMKSSWTQVGGSEQTQLFAIAMTSIIKSHLSREPEQILDYGCATGDATPVLGTAFPDSTIFLHDISPTGVKKGVRRYSENYSVEAWRDQTVDLVFSSNVLEHFKDPRQFFEEVGKATNGSVVVMCPWNERHPDGSPISPERPNGEHFWTIDNDFLDRFVPDSLVETFRSQIRVPVAWPFGEQLILVLSKK